MKKRVVIFRCIPLFLLMAIIIGAFFSFEASNHSKFKKVRRFILHDLYNDSQISFEEELKRQSITAIYIFSSWCSVCISNHKMLHEIKKTNLVKIYGIAWKDFRQNIKKFLQKYHNPFVAVGYDNQDILNKAMPITGVPELFLVNSQRQILLHLTGKISEADFQQIIKIITHVNK
ncbi:thioredoxin-like domain-containing protein [Flavobacteriaceae bacterium]|nr:thioredoxin-like domain-containing protein [Flavobacteriaceae bacterium]